MPSQILRLSASLIVGVTLFLSTHAQSTTEPVNLLLSTLPAGQDPQRYPGYVAPKYEAITEQSLYLTMRDGVKIAVLLVLPKELPATEKIPAIMNMTRYWRAKQGQSSSLFFPSHGYATVFVDARGTGASFGVWRAPFSQDEIKDYGEVAEWIVKQPWSNGRVGATGNSYGGNTALWLSSQLNPAIKAVIPRHFEFDLYAETPYPGGLFTDWLIKAWNEGNRQLDNNPGVRLVDEDSDQKLYRQATQQRAQNMDVYATALKTTFRDDKEFGVTIDELSLHRYGPQIEKSGVAINSWGGWFDASTADSTIKTFLSLKNPQRAIIGAWNHGANQNASPYHTSASHRVMQGFEWLRFFDYHLKGIDTALDKKNLLFYFTVGEEKWKATTTWPVAGTKMMRWYLDTANTLTLGKPESALGEDAYTVNFEATTGERNRWHTQVGGGQVIYLDRADEDKKLLSYTSPPLDKDTEITGYPIVELLVSSTHSDGAFYVYLEEVDEAGKVTYLTEGLMRALHRKVSNEAPPTKLLVPYHSFKKKDALPLVPGQTAELKFGLLPISVLVKKGHRLRIAIAGHDKNTFARIPAEGIPTITIKRNNAAASWIELPVVIRN